MEELVTDISRQKTLQLLLLTSRRPVCPAVFGELQEKRERVGARHGIDKKGLTVCVFRLPSYPTFGHKTPTARGLPRQ